MTKIKHKPKWQTVSLILPAQWVKLLDADARKMKRTRTAIVKSLIIDHCIKGAK